MFKERGEEAVNFYVSLFKNSKVINITRMEADGTPIPKGALLNATFELDGVRFMATDGGPHFSFTEGMSLYINCDTQEEIDYFWEKLTTDGGAESMCGWARDKFGVSWQIVPPILGELLQDKDREKAGRVMNAMLQMKKIDIAKLREAYEG